MAIVAGLALLRSIDAEQSHELRPEFHGIAVDDVEARPRARSDSVIVGLREGRNGKEKREHSESSHRHDLPTLPAVREASLR